jgi:hypothetical protein
VLVIILIMLLIAAAFGVLGAVLKATFIIIVSLILAVVLLTAGTAYYVRHRFRQYAREVERQRGSYPAQGHRRTDLDDDPPQLPG